MGAHSKIEWCDHTFNPWWGCTKVSPACDHCYAEAFSKRTGHKVWGKDAPRRTLSAKYWDQPFDWDYEAQKSGVRQRVFCGSMCDVMEDRPDLKSWREDLYQTIGSTPFLDWLLLTKRPQNFRRFLPKEWLDKPLSNVWGMTTVESPEYYWRIDALLDTPFVIRGISYEPALAAINLTPEMYCGGLHWIIAGGESGGGARPAALDWFRSVRDQCQTYDVAFFLKQLGGVRDKRGNLDQLPEDLRIREFPTQ